MWLTGQRAPSNPESITAPLWLGLILVTSGLLAVVLTLNLLLSESDLESEAFRLEKARGMRGEFQEQELKLKGRADSIVQSLSERIAERAANLEALSGEISDKERKRDLIRAAAYSEMQELHREIYGIGERKGLRQQWLFVGVSFVLGFVVNWLSSPFLEILRGIHF